MQTVLDIQARQLKPNGSPRGTSAALLPESTLGMNEPTFNSRNTKHTLHYPRFRYMLHGTVTRSYDFRGNLQLPEVDGVLYNASIWNLLSPCAEVKHDKKV